MIRIKFESETKKAFNQDYNRRSGGKKYTHLIKPNNKDFNFDANTHGYKMGYYLTNVEKCDPWEIPSSTHRYGRTYVDIRGYSKKGKSSKKNEAFYRKNKYKTMDFYGNEVTREEEIYDPTYDSKYKRLIKKPLNTLTADEVKYIYAIETARYMQQVQQFDTIEQAIEYAMRRYDDDDIQECTDWLHTLSFPLTVYRAVYDRTELNNISGKNHDICWSTNPEIYTNEKSSFSRCNKIVKTEINQNIINVPTTIERFLSYTGKRKSYGFGEFEINLKPNFKQSDLMNLQLIDKKDLMR